MSKPPYPPYPPSYQKVHHTGGYSRTCLVVELLALEDLDGAQLAYIQEQLEATLSRLLPAVLEKSQVVTPDRFDRPLCDGLRL